MPSKLRMNGNERKHLAGRMRRFRKRARLSMELAAKEIGVDWRVVSEIEKMGRDVTLETLVRLTEAEERLGIPCVLPKERILATAARKQVAQRS